MLVYMSADIICSEKRTVFREHSSKKNANFEEQIMSELVFKPKWRLLCLQIFFATRAVLKIREYLVMWRASTNRAIESLWRIIMSQIIHEIFSLALDWLKRVMARLVKTRYVTDYSPAKTRKYPSDISENIWMITNTKSSIWLWKYARAQCICPLYLSAKLTTFPELLSRKIVLFSNQTMSADMHTGIVSRLTEAIVYIVTRGYGNVGARS